MVQRFDAHNAGFYAQVRRLAILLVCFETLLSLVSWALLLYASTLSFKEHPGWIGPFDGAIAFAVVILAAVIERSFRGYVPLHLVQAAYNLVTYAIPTLLVLLFVFQRHLIWNTLLPGLAWRVYIILLVLPASLATMRSSEPVN